MTPHRLSRARNLSLSRILCCRSFSLSIARGEPKVPCTTTLPRITVFGIGRTSSSSSSSAPSRSSDNNVITPISSLPSASSSDSVLASCSTKTASVSRSGITARKGTTPQPCTCERNHNLWNGPFSSGTAAQRPGSARCRGKNGRGVEAARTWDRTTRRRPGPSRATAPILTSPGVLLARKAQSVSPPSPPKNAAVLIAPRTGVARA